MRRVVFAAVPPVQILDLTGPYEVFARCGGYRVELVTSSDDALVGSSSGLAVAGARPYRSLRGAVDTLLIPGGDGAEELRCDARFLDWVARMATSVRRVGSICTGVFPLAAAGILDGRRATTHWGWCDRLARAYPAVRVEADPIFVQDGSVFTSAGVTAGIDLALAMVEEDHGRLKAKTIARELVMYLRRPGGQSQFSEFLPSGAEQRTSIEALQVWIASNLRRDLGVEALAGRCAMSPRHFARVFAAETGVTPARFVERMRVTAARELLEDSSLGLKQIAERCGFGGIDSLRRSFVRTLAVTPSRYLQTVGRRTAPAADAARATTAAAR
jgi:transcriptional regulator GlxA family with amidase domain